MDSHRYCHISTLFWFQVCSLGLIITCFWASSMAIRPSSSTARARGWSALPSRTLISINSIGLPNSDQRNQQKLQQSCLDQIDKHDQQNQHRLFLESAKPSSPTLIWPMPLPARQTSPPSTTVTSCPMFFTSSFIIKRKWKLIYPAAAAATM